MTVTVLDHPEYGQTVSQPDGSYSMVVNGGGTITLDYDKDGYAPAQRQLAVPWADYAFVDDLVLVQLDQRVTDIDLSSPLSPTQVARGSVVTDQDGTRQATLMFPAGTTAEMYLPDGTPVPLEQLSVRATEYTVGPTGEDAMPGALPPASGYTYAVDYSIDQARAADAEIVYFSQPVYSYTDNFVGIEVGTDVPVGNYDQEYGEWYSEEDGRVIEILDETNGAAVLDVSGNGNPATQEQLDELNVTPAELEQLADLYQPGKQLWRVGMDHFSAWDFNWPFAFPPDATSPSGHLAAGFLSDCTLCPGSTIEAENQSLGEDLALAGSGRGLHYNSSRQLGRTAGRSQTIPLTGDTVPASLQRIELNVDVAGQSKNVEFTPSANLSYRYTWDGKDAFGRQPVGPQKLTAEVRYVFQATAYTEPADFYASFAQTSPTGNVVSDQARGEVATRQILTGTVQAQVPDADRIGGWTLSGHHHYDAATGTLFQGDGRQRGTDQIAATVRTIAGDINSDYESSGDGGPARDARFDRIQALDVAPDGSIYMADPAFSVVRRIDPQGTISTVAGTDMATEYGVSPDGTPALEAGLDVRGVAIDDEGAIYIAEGDRVLRIDADGRLVTVAGDNAHEYDQSGDCSRDPQCIGDGGPATQARLHTSSVIPSPDGSLYILDGLNNRIRRVGTDGIISTVAGRGRFSCGWYGDPPCPEAGHGDGGPATEAYMRIGQNTFDDLAVDSAGNLYVSEYDRIRRIDSSGTITTVVGGGAQNEGLDDHYGGIGGPATQAWFRGIHRFTVSPDGQIYFHVYDRIFRATPAGKVTVAAGGRPFSDYQITDGLARQVHTNATALTLDQQGRLLLADSNILRRLEGALAEPDQDGNVKVPSQDGSELFEFDRTGRHLKTYDTLLGIATSTFAYNDAGELTSVTDQFGNQTAIQRSPDGTAEAIVGPYGQTNGLEIDAAGQLTAVTDPAAATTRLGYKTGGLLTSLRSPAGGLHSYAYDAEGLLVSDTDPDGVIKTLTRTETEHGRSVTLQVGDGPSTHLRVSDDATTARIREQVTASGETTTSETRPDGRVVTTNPDGTQTATKVTSDPRFGGLVPQVASLTEKLPSGLQRITKIERTAVLSDPDNPLSLETLVVETSVNGRVSRQTYDAAARRLTTRSPEGRISTIEYGAQGLPVLERKLGSEPTAYDYDERGRLLSAQRAARHSTISYDPLGRVASVTDNLGRVTETGYDEGNQLVRVADDSGAAATFGYDQDGALTSITPPDRTEHSVSYSRGGRPVSATAPDTGLSQERRYRNRFDAGGRLQETTDPDGRTTSYVYGSEHRLESVTSPEGETSYGYDEATGAIVRVEGPGEKLEFAYDGPLMTEQRSTGVVDATVKRVYDDDLGIRSESVGGKTVGYRYDGDGLLITAGDQIVTHDVASGHVTGSELGEVRVARAWNELDDLEHLGASHGSTDLFSVRYQRDQSGRITVYDETIGSETHRYAVEYDAVGRVTEVQRDGIVWRSYSYDRNGNRIADSRDGGPRREGVVDAQDRLLRLGALRFDYNASGQLQFRRDAATGDTTHYEYDSESHLRAVVLPGGETVRYVVDPLGRRVGVRFGGQLERGYIWGEADNPVAETRSDGTVRSRFVYGTSSHVPDYMIRDNREYSLIRDHLGSIRLVVDSETGDVVQRLDYDIYGRVLTDTNPGFQPFGYAGGFYDHRTGLVTFGYRDYDADTGRFTTKDPLGFAGGDAGLYSYVGGDPVNWTDPGGDLCLSPSCLIKTAEDVIGTVGDVADTVTTPLDWAADGIGEVADEVGITDLAESAQRFYADVTNDPTASGLEKGAAWVGGVFSSLATRDTIGCTALTVASGGTVGSYFAGRRVIGGIHGAHHTFPLVGRRRHLQATTYIKGRKGSHRNFRIPLP